MKEFKNKPTKLDIGEQINDAFEIFKKMALTGGLAMLSIYLIISILLFVGIGFFFKPEEFAVVIRNFHPEKLSFNDQMIYLAAVVLFSALISPFMAGFLKMANDADKKEEVQFSAIFTYVNSPQFIHIFLATAVITLASTGSHMLILHFISERFAFFLGYLATLSIATLTYLVVPHIIFGHLSFVTAIKASVNQVLSNFFPAILLMLVAFILVVVGIFGFCIGILFTVPFVYIMPYCMYKKLNY